MYIARRTGGGRGVYEIAGETASGLTSGDLLDREIVFELTPALLLPSGVTLHVQGGKHRLILTHGGIQIQRQIAAALLLPSPRRADEGMGSSAQLIRTKEYALERIQLSYVNSIAADKAFVVPDRIELKNASASMFISVQERLAEVAAIWSRADRAPEPLRSLIARHEELVTAGDPITTECEDVVSEIQKAAADAWPGETSVTSDPVGVLASRLGVSVPPLVEPVEPAMTAPTFAFEGGFDLSAAMRVPERVRRAIIQRRGQRSFRQALLSAYGGKCQVTEYSGEPALEAAHIYPYREGAEYTNDPRNGLLLRSDIHVLFDLGLLKVAPVALRIRIMPPLAASSYAALDGNTLRVSSVLRPSDEALAKKWEMLTTVV